MAKASVPFKAGLYAWLKENPDNQMEYLKTSIEDNSDLPEALLRALRDIAEVRGFENLSKDAGLSPKALYKILSDDKEPRPRLETIHHILRALGLRLTVQPIVQKQAVAGGK